MYCPCERTPPIRSQAIQISQNSLREVKLFEEPDYLTDKYFGRMRQGAGITGINVAGPMKIAGSGVAYETCRTYCLDGGNRYQSFFD